MLYKEQDVTKPHGVEQNIKMELMAMIHSASNPFDIICHIARYLESTSTEAGYANHVRENLRAVYGLALHDKKLLEDELKDVEDRLQRLEQAATDKQFTPEELKRIDFAVVLHRKNIAHLQELIRKAEVDGTPHYFNT